MRRNYTLTIIYFSILLEISYPRLASVYEDKVLGRNRNGQIFSTLKNKTFPEFVDHVLTEIESNQAEHWRPQYLNCNYCGINYDLIGRAETLTRDLQYIATKRKLNTISSSQEENIRVNTSGGSSSRTKKVQRIVQRPKKTTEEKARDYFSTLNSTQLENLYSMFQADFEMFGYSVYPYVAYS